MKPLSKPKRVEYTGITTSSNMAYTIVKQGKGVGVEEMNGSAEYEVVDAPGAQQPSHSQSQRAMAEESGYDLRCPPDHLQPARQVPTINVPPVPQGGDEKGLDEFIYEPIPGDQ